MNAASETLAAFLALAFVVFACRTALWVSVSRSKSDSLLLCAAVLTPSSYTSAFPVGLTAGATWSRTLWYDRGNKMGAEQRDKSPAQ